MLCPPPAINPCNDRFSKKPVSSTPIRCWWGGVGIGALPLQNPRFSDNETAGPCSPVLPQLRPITLRLHFREDSPLYEYRERNKLACYENLLVLYGSIENPFLDDRRLQPHRRLPPTRPTPKYSAGNTHRSRAGGECRVSSNRGGF